MEHKAGDRIEVESESNRALTSSRRRKGGSGRPFAPLPDQLGRRSREHLHTLRRRPAPVRSGEGGVAARPANSQPAGAIEVDGRAPTKCSHCRRTRRSGGGGPPRFASTRTTLFDAFPRSGLPRGFRDYADWVATRRAAAARGRDLRPVVSLVGRAPAAAIRHRRGPDHGRAEQRRGRGCRRRAGAGAGEPGARSRRDDPGHRAAGRRADRGEPLPGRPRRHRGAPDRRAHGPAPPCDRPARAAPRRLPATTPDGWAASVSSTPCTGSFARTAPSANSPMPATVT